MQLIYYNVPLPQGPVSGVMVKQLARNAQIRHAYAAGISVLALTQQHDISWQKVC
jgi:hypothetical protein